MLRLIASLIVLAATLLSASNSQVVEAVSKVIKKQASGPLMRVSNLRSDQSELQKILGKWEVRIEELDGVMMSYFNITSVEMGQKYYEAFGTDSPTDYSSGDGLECVYELSSTYSQKYACISQLYEGMYNWYFFDLTKSDTIEGVYVFSSVDDLDEKYAWSTSALHGKKTSGTVSSTTEDILHSNLTTLKNRLLSTKSYDVSGSFASYDFAGVESAFDWAFVTPQGAVYQLQGNPPSANDVFGWKPVSVHPAAPAWYMAYLGDWDNDGNGRYDWILVGNGFDAVYKLEGVSATGTFAYSDPINIEYSISSDKKTITFGSAATLPVAPPPSTDADTQKVNSFVQNAADQLGCSYTAQSNAVQLRSAIPLSTLLSVAVVGNVFKEDVEKTTKDGNVSLRIHLRETEVKNGSCGGTMTSIDTDKVGGSVVFANYCTGEVGGVQSTVNGKMTMSTVKASETKSTITLSTTTPLRVVSTNPNTNEKVDVTMTVDSGKLVINNGYVLTAKSVVITNNVEHDTLTLNNVSMTSTEDGAATIDIALVDPVLGRVSLHMATSQQNDHVVLDSFTLTDTNGMVATMTETGTKAVFNVSTNGRTNGTLDCSTADFSSMFSVSQ